MYTHIGQQGKLFKVRVTLGVCMTLCHWQTGHQHPTLWVNLTGSIAGFGRLLLKVFVHLPLKLGAPIGTTFQGPRQQARLGTGQVATVN